MNIRFYATQLGDMLKYSTTINEINRAAKALFRFQCDEFPNESITSVRAQLVYNWLLTLGRQEMNPDDRLQLLRQFSLAICPVEDKDKVEALLAELGAGDSAQNREDSLLFSSRQFHPDVITHCKTLFLQGNYFHAVFEACKAYNHAVRDKAYSTKDGQTLMLEVWGCDKGVLKLTQCKSETDRNVQDGVKFLSPGLMQAMRNPTAHEPALNWRISKEDGLDVLSFVSFLFRQLDKAVYYPGMP